MKKLNKYTYVNALVEQIEKLENGNLTMQNYGGLILEKDVEKRVTTQYIEYLSNLVKNVLINQVEHEEDEDIQILHELYIVDNLVEKELQDCKAINYPTDLPQAQLKEIIERLKIIFEEFATEEETVSDHIDNFLNTQIGNTDGTLDAIGYKFIIVGEVMDGTQKIVGVERIKNSDFEKYSM